ncbi:putative WD40-repeat-containing domain superfamily [Helianthus annuus]|nr:putative WD40-repeat-containing domain superfamily [Helianthus annuus]
MYSGHRNNFMVKGVSFFGPDSEHVMSGLDCVVWKKNDGRVIRIMEGNKCIVNQVEPHPNILSFASSELEKDTTLWAPVSLITFLHWFMSYCR